MTEPLPKGAVRIEDLKPAYGTTPSSGGHKEVMKKKSPPASKPAIEESEVKKTSEKETPKAAEKVEPEKTSGEEPKKPPSRWGQ